MATDSVFLSNPPVVVTLCVYHMIAYLLVVKRQCLLLSGDVELNPGPLDQKMIDKILSTVDDITFDEESWNDVIIACSSLAPKWKQLSGFIGLSHKTIHAINGNNPGDKEGAWNDALMQWILQDYNVEKHGLPSWKTLLKTISRVDQPLFEELATEHQAKDAKLAPTVSDQAAGKLEDTASNADTGYHDGNSVVSSSQISEGTLLVPTSSKEDHVEKRDETASNTDTGYETASVASASSSSQITKQVSEEIEIPDHILSQIRKKYRTIKNAYKKQCPCQLKNTASLELVEGLPYSSNRSADERGIAGKSIRLPYSSLFKGDQDRKEGCKRILIVGEAGTGKTVLCASIAEDWAKGELFQEFLMLFLLPLNHRGVASAQNLQELFKNLEFDGKVCSTVATYLTANKKGNILMIADGWDELSESHSSNDSFLSQLLFGDLLPGATLTVVVTSRSVPVTQQSISRFVTIQGFSEETTKTYIQCEFRSSQQQLSYITEELEGNPLIGSMCNVPIDLAMICNFRRSCDDPLPNNMPELYDRLAWNLAQMKINSTKEYEDLKVSNYRDLPGKLQQSWSHLCRLAFEKCQADFSQVVASSFLSTELETFGLLKPAAIGSDEVMFSFLSPAFRYYLAISHLTMQPQNEQLEVIKSMCNVNPLFCRFYLSVSENVSSDIVSEVVQKLHHSCKDMCLLSFESKNEIVDREVAKVLHTSGSPIMLHAQNAYECVAMVHVLEKIEQPSTVEINFQNCKLQARQVPKLASVLGDRSKMIQVKGLDLSDNCLNDAMIVNFFSRAASAFSSLEKLFLRSCDIGPKGLRAIISALATSSCKSLTQLDLSFNSLSGACLECFQQHIACDNLGKIEILLLKASFAEDVSAKFLKCFATSVSGKCQRLRRLDLSGNKFGACDDPEISAVISQLTATLGTKFDLQMDDNYMSEVEKSFLTIMEESIRTKGTIDHTIAHGVIVGPGRSGKDTLMKRLTGEGPPKPGTISSSTGVLENIVKVEVKKMCTVATAVCNLEWQKLEFDKEALELMMTTAKKYSHIGAVQRPVIIKYILQGSKAKSEEEMKPPIQPPDRGKKPKVVKNEEDRELTGSESADSVTVDKNEESSDVKQVVVYRDDLAPVDIFKQAVKLRRMDALREHLESSWSLYLTNTGGQIEFQEHLPLLVCGPSIFFVIVPLHHDLDKPYEVRYEYPDGLVKKYSSTPTLMQELLQTLSTIYALDYATVQIDDEEVQLKPKVFFVGTHKDCLPEPESAREKKIKQIDKKLQDQVRQTSLFHQGSIQFAHPKQMLFTVNNLSQSDDDFQKIRSAVQHTVEKKSYTEFTVQCPSSWLIFSLILRAKHMSDQVMKIEDCFKIAQECGISSHDELTTALSFIHSRLGLVRYYNVKELDSLVVIDPQVLFDKITDLVVETFINDDINVEQNEIEEFREKGIISVAAMKKISESSSKGVRLPFKWFTMLLNYLRIAALFKDHQGEKYFFPSALCHVPEADDSSSESSSDSSEPHSSEPQATQPSPFLVAFETGFCPRGIAGALMKCLMTNEMNSSRKWKLLPKKIFRNEVSFHIEACGDITIRVLPTHLEITIDSNDTSDCEEVYTQITKGMKIASTLYKKCEFFSTFYCTLSKCKKNPHPAEIEWKQNVPYKLWCKILNKTSSLPSGYHLWNIQRKDVKARSIAEVSYEHLGKIADCMVEWRGPIADELKLAPSDVAAIEEKHQKQLKLQSREALYAWKQRNGSKATYSELMEIFERAGFRSYADEVKKIAELSDSEADDSSGTREGQPRTYPTLPKVEAFSCDQHPPENYPEAYVMVEKKGLTGTESDVGKEEELESHEVTKVLVPQLTPSKSDFKGESNQDHPDEQQPPKSPGNEFEVIATFEYSPEQADELPLTKGERLTVLKEFDDGWYLARNHQGREGHIPSNFVKRVSGQLLGNKLPRKEFEIMATYVYSPKEEDELPLTEGEKLTVISEPEDGWYLARNNQGREGHIPSNYVKRVSGQLYLHQAASSGQLDELKRLIKEEKLDVLQKDENGDTVLHCAAQHGHLNVLEYLLKEHGLDPACRGWKGQTPLHRAALYKHLELVRYLVGEQQVDPLCHDEEGYTPLHKACTGGDIDVILYLISEMKKHASLDSIVHDRAKDGNTPAHFAAREGHLPVVKHFVTELHFDPNTPGFMGRPPLTRAADGGHLDIVRYFIEELQCDPLYAPGEEKVTSLHRAAARGHIDVIRYLTLTRKCSPLVRDIHGDTPLHDAASNGRYEVVKFFISELKCNPNVPGQHGRIALHFASREGHLDIVRYLIDVTNCNPASLDDRHTTPLHLASGNGHLQVVKCLIEEQHCDLLCYDKDNDTPLHWAAQGGRLEVVKYFKEAHNCQLDVRNSNNQTPLELARQGGHTNIVEYLSSFQ